MRMTKMTTVEARERFADLVNRAAYGKERIGLTRHGKQVAAVVPAEDLALLERLEDEIDLADARAALAEAREVGTVSLEAFRAARGL
jgi:prevent-host-death family protein